MSTPTPTLAEEVLGGLALGPAEVARLVPGRRNGKPTSPSTVWRWFTTGVRVNGRIVKLESIQLGRNRLTSRSALLRFLARQQGADEAASSPPTTSPPSSRRDEQDRAEAELAKMGV